MTITDEITICECWSYTTAYRATQWWEKGSYRIYWKANASGGVTVYNKFDVEGDSELNIKAEVKVTQTTWIKAPWLLQDYVVNTAKRAHMESLERLSRTRF